MSLPWKTWVPKADRDQDHHSKNSIADVADVRGRTPFTCVRPSFVPAITQTKSCSLPSYAGLRRTSRGGRNGQKTTDGDGGCDQRKSSNFRFFWKAKVNEERTSPSRRRSNDSEQSSSSSLSSSSSCKMAGGSGSSGRGGGGSLRNVQQQKQQQQKRTTGKRAVLPDEEWDVNSNEHLSRVLGLQRRSAGSIGSRSCESLCDLRETSHPQKKSFGLAGKFNLFAACKGNSRVLDTFRRKRRNQARRKVATERARACTGDTSSEDEERQWQRIRRTQFDDEPASFVGRPPYTNRRGQAVLEARTERYYKRKSRDGGCDDIRSPDSSACVSKSVSPIQRKFHESADVIRLLPTFSSSEATGNSRYSSRRAPAPPPRSSSSKDAARPPRGRRPLSYAFDNRHLLVPSAEVEAEDKDNEVSPAASEQCPTVRLPEFRVPQNTSSGNVAARLSFTTSASVVYTHTFVEPAVNASAGVIRDDGISSNDSQISSRATNAVGLQSMSDSPTVTPQRRVNYCTFSKQPFRDNNNNRPPPSPSKHAESSDVKCPSTIRRMSTVLETPLHRTSSPQQRRNGGNNTHYLASDKPIETLEPAAAAAVGVDLQRRPCGDKSMGKAMDNLEDAIQELEVIYRNMRDADDEADRLLDGDNKNRVRKLSRISLGFSNDSDLTTTTTTTSDRDINASQPDKVTDDLAFRKLNRTGFETTTTTGVSSPYPVKSYLLLSPALSPAISVDDLHADRAVVGRSESDRTVFDDVTFRNMRDANLQKKIVDPQPPFGIPLAPFSRASSNDYLHAEAQEDHSRQKSRLRRFTPDLVHDDLAYRNLRKDSRRPITDGASSAATTTTTTCTGDHLSAMDANSRALNFEELDNIVIFDLRQMAANRKRVRAVKSLSANVGHMIAAAQRNDHNNVITQPRIILSGDGSKSMDDLSMITPADQDRKLINARESREVIAKGLMRFKRHSLASASSLATMETAAAANVASTADFIAKPKDNRRLFLSRIRPSSATDVCRKPTINCGMDYGSVSDSAPIDHSCYRRVRIEGRAAPLPLPSWSSTRRLDLRPIPIETQVTKPRPPKIESKSSTGQPIDESRLDELLTSLAQIGGDHNQTDLRNNIDDDGENVLSAFTVNDDKSGEIYIRLPLPGLVVLQGGSQDDYDYKLPFPNNNNNNNNNNKGKMKPVYV